MLVLGYNLNEVLAILSERCHSISPNAKQSLLYINIQVSLVICRKYVPLVWTVNTVFADKKDAF